MPANWYEQTMDERIEKLTTPESCARFAKNAEERGRPDLAKAANRRAVALAAQKHGATTTAERECLEAVYAYERTLYAKHGKAVRASYTWRMIKSHGIIPAVERTVTNPRETAGFKALTEMGLQDRAFEAVVLRHPGLFSAEAVRCSKARMEIWERE